MLALPGNLPGGDEHRDHHPPMQEITIHEKVYATIAILVILVAGAFGLYALTHQESTTPAAPVGGTGFALQCVDSTEFIATTSAGYDAACTGNASSTTDYLGAGSNIATSTLETVNTAHASSADVNIYAPTASGTTAVQNYSFWASYNQIDWYPLPSADESPSGNTLALTGTASTTEIHLANLNEPYLQLRTHAVTSSSTVYSQIIPLSTITQ